MWQSIRLTTNEYTSRCGCVRTVDRIELRGGDMTLRKDITGARDVDLTHRMAESLGLDVWDDRQMPLGLEGQE